MSYWDKVNFPIFVEMKLSKSLFLSLHCTLNRAEGRREWGHARLVGGGPERLRGLICSATPFFSVLWAVRHRSHIGHPVPGMPTEVGAARRSYSAGLR